MQGVVFIGSWDRNLYAINATSGKQVWQHETAYPIESSPTVRNP